MKNYKMPKATEILNHWYKTLTEDYGKGLDDEWTFKPNATFICFACCMDVGTERCHILPRCEGGSDEVDNLHLLCKECHLESETLSGEVYWQWLQSKDYSNSGSFLRVWNKTKITQSLYKQKKFDLIPPDVLVGINNFLNTQKTNKMENMTVQETVAFTIRVANFMEWYFLVWGCIGWAAALAIYYHHIKSGGKQWI